MSVGGIGGPNYPSSFQFQPKNPEDVLQAFQQTFDLFIQDPTKENAQSLLTFLQTFSAQLAPFAIYPPYIGESWERLSGRLEDDLGEFIAGKCALSPLLEVAQNLRIILGIGVTPADILSAFEEAMAAFRTDPHDLHASDMVYLYLSTPGYVDALAQSGHFPPGFVNLCQMAAASLSTFRSQNGSEEATLLNLEAVARALNFPF